MPADQEVTRPVKVRTQHGRLGPHPRFQTTTIGIASAARRRHVRSGILPHPNPLPFLPVRGRSRSKSKPAARAGTVLIVEGRDAGYPRKLPRPASVIYEILWHGEWQGMTASEPLPFALP